MIGTFGHGGDLVDVGFGLLGSARRVTALGHNPDVDTATTPEDIWTGGGLYPWLAAATALEVVSDNAADAAAGTGARTARVDGLDANYAEVSQTVTLNGTTPVALATPLLRVNGALIMSAGSGKTNAGSLSVRDAGAGTVRSIVPAGYGITRQSVFTVPAGWTLQVVSMLFCFNRASAGARFATFATYVQSSAGFFRMPLELTIGDEPPYRHDGLPGILVAEKTDFCLRCNFVSNNDSDISAGWLGVMRKSA